MRKLIYATPLAAEDRAPSIAEIARTCFPTVNEVLASQLADCIGRSPPRTAVLMHQQRSPTAARQARAYRFT